MNMSRKLWPLAALVIVAGCSSDPEATSDASSSQGQAVKFAQCMRDNGVSEFPDPDASGELTIDGVVNGSSINPDGPAWQAAIDVCKDLRPSGFTGDQDVSDSEQEVRLQFAECIREHGVEDFPDPAKGDPLVDTNRIPSSATEAGMGILNAAMETCGDLAEAATGQ